LKQLRRRPPLEVLAELVDKTPGEEALPHRAIRQTAHHRAAGLKELARDWSTARARDVSHGGLSCFTR
jgi:hypothetical protein